MEELVKKSPDKIRDDKFKETADLVNSDYMMFSDDYIRRCKKNGLKVILPKPNQLLIDIDSEEQYQEHLRRMMIFKEIYFNEFTIEEHPSIHGLPRRHVTITMKPSSDGTLVVFTNLTRITWQSLLASDPIRDILSMQQMMMGDEHPVLFSEKMEDTI